LTGLSLPQQANARCGLDRLQRLVGLPGRRRASPIRFIRKNR